MTTNTRHPLTVTFHTERCGKVRVYLMALDWQDACYLVMRITNNGHIEIIDGCGKINRIDLAFKAKEAA